MKVARYFGGLSGGRAAAKNVWGHGLTRDWGEP